MRLPLPALLFLLASCTTWQVVDYPAPQDTAWRATGRLRLKTLDGHTLFGDTARMVSDSVQLTVSSSRPAVTIARREVDLLERNKVDGGKTALLLLGGLVVGSYLVLKSIAEGLGAAGG